MAISLIAAVGEGSVIGLRGSIPWDLPADRALFRRTTWGHPVVMGRKTYESLGGPLPGRAMVVLSRDRTFRAAGCQVFSSFQKVLALSSGSVEEIFVAGGGHLYASAFPFAQRFYITHVKAVFEGDAFFPKVDWGSLKRVRSESLEGDVPAEFVVYERAK